MVQSASAKQTTSAIRHKPTQMYVSPSPMSTSVAAQYTLLPTKYSYLVSAPCTYPAFNPPASSQLPTNPQDLHPATVTSSLPQPNPPFRAAAPLTYSPAVTYRASVAKPKKKRKFFPTKIILPLTQPASTPTNLSQLEVPVPVSQPEPKVPEFQPEVPVFQPEEPEPEFQPEEPEPAFQSEEPELAFQSEEPEPAFQLKKPEPAFQPEV
ncbi:hypothetical protein AB205_0015970, partial [Aquarana catesbeiana]